MGRGLERVQVGQILRFVRAESGKGYRGDNLREDNGDVLRTCNHKQTISASRYDRSSHSGDYHNDHTGYSHISYNTKEL